jgi:hypothetical protein
VAGVAERRASVEEMQRSGIMLSLLKSFERLCPSYRPPAGSEKQPRGEKRHMTVVVVVGFVVVVRAVEGAEVVEGGVMDKGDDILVLVGVEKLYEEDVVERGAVVLLGGVEIWGDVAEDKLVVGFVEEEETIGLEVETGLLVDDERIDELELDTTTAARLLYINNLDEPPYYPC